MDAFISFCSLINSSHEYSYTVIRVVIDYFFAILLIRLGSKRLQVNAPFDFILVIMLGGAIVQNINASITLLTSLSAGILLRMLHRVLAMYSYKHARIDKFLKGKPQILFSKKKFVYKNLKSNQLTEEEVLEACRSKLNSNDLAKVKEARLERSGEITLIV